MNKIAQSPGKTVYSGEQWNGNAQWDEIMRTHIPHTFCSMFVLFLKRDALEINLWKIFWGIYSFIIIDILNEGLCKWENDTSVQNESRRGQIMN